MPSETPPIPDDDAGAIEAALVRVFGRSYRTTIAGVIALAAVVVGHTPGVPSWVVELTQEIAALAAGAGLLIAKDSRVSGAPR